MPSGPTTSAGVRRAFSEGLILYCLSHGIGDSACADSARENRQSVRHIDDFCDRIFLTSDVKIHVISACAIPTCRDTRYELIAEGGGKVQEKWGFG